jgi:hypothetical protein
MQARFPPLNRPGRDDGFWIGLQAAVVYAVGMCVVPPGEQRCLWQLRT